MIDRPAGVHLRIYRMLLLLYPSSFRREYGHLMAQAFSDRLTERGARRTWFLIGRDLSLSLPRQILEASQMDQKWLGALTALSAILFMVAMGMGLGSPIVLVTLAVTTVGLLVVLSRKAGDRPTEFLYGGATPKAFKWWTVLAILLAATYVVAAAGQLINDPKATNVGALGIMTGFAALIVGGLMLRARSHVAGNWMVIFATVPALMFFWIIVPALVGLAIIAGALTEIVRATPQQPVTI